MGVQQISRAKHGGAREVANLVREREQEAEEGMSVRSRTSSAVTLMTEQTLEKVAGYSKKLNDIQELIHVNEAVCKRIVANAMDIYGISQEELDEHMKQAEKDGRQSDKFAVLQTLKHYVRDWADEGAEERNQAFPCILSTLNNIKIESPKHTSLKVLLPGSGVGRLGHDVANLGGRYLLTSIYPLLMSKQTSK
jgi:hypothetical protein